MSVYIDNMRAKPGRPTMCYMIADTREELHHIADAMGVARHFIRFAGTPGERFDITNLSMRHRAVELGAREVSTSDLARIMKLKYEARFIARIEASRGSNAVPSHPSKGVPAPGSSPEREACRDAASPCDILCKSLKSNNFPSLSTTPDAPV